MTKRDPHQKNTVLILDDEPQYLDWLIDYLRSKGYRVELTTTLADAIRLLASAKYRLVILDLAVPVRSDWKIRLQAEGATYEAYPGLFAAEEARNRGHRGRQVVVYSVHDSAAVREITDRLGVQYITKGRPKIFKQEIDVILAYDPMAHAKTRRVNVRCRQSEKRNRRDRRKHRSR